MRNLSTEVLLRGQEITIDEIVVCPAEPDVGIFSPYPDGFILKDEAGNAINWELSKEEQNAIDNAIADAISAAEEDAEDAS